ncbi:MAG: rhomboid family intramembrane serine protease [Prevotella sp.]|nr:rhomboid family intramembrane serine protease [Prevotella sp.]
MRSIPVVTKNLLIINVLGFLACVLLEKTIDLNNVLGLHFFMAKDFAIYQLFTYMFMHGGWMHLFFNMFALWMFGCVVERVWGAKKFLFYYILCGIGAGLIQELTQYIQYSVENLSAYEYVKISINGTMQTIPTGEYLNLWTTVGASGAIYAILLAFGMLFPEERVFIFPLPVPIKAKWFVMIYVVLELFMALGTSGDDVAHFAHLGGMLFGFLLIMYWKKHPTANGSIGGSGGDVFGNLKKKWKQRTPKGSDNADGGPRKADWDYNANKKATEEEIDRILDKIRKNGYASLTKEEKQFLFESSNKNK